jgi:hypothetical protein
MKPVIRDPTAWLPIALSVAALVDVLVFAVVFGSVAQPDGDEGTPAHLFQALMVVAALLVVVFAVRWLPRAPWEAAVVLGFQVLAAALPLATLAFLESQAGV